MIIYTIYNPTTKETKEIFGYNYSNACERAKLNSREWEVIERDYID